MTTKTLDATYNDGSLLLAEPLDLAPNSAVRVRVEIPRRRPADADVIAKLNEAYADAPDEDERALQKHMARIRRERAGEW